MTPGLVHKITDFCQKNSLLDHHDRVIVGVSGGPDSLCLLHVLNTLRSSFDLKLTIAHLNHQLRGVASQADEDFVRDISARWQLPIFIETADVATMATQRKQSLEEAARQIRYAFLGRVAAEVNAKKIAVGHNADDQVETVLMHFLRGSGLAGLRGMLPLMPLAALRLYPDNLSASSASPSPQLIRPLLETPRREIEAYCQIHHLAPQQDYSNQDTTFFRNRLRHELIPLLESYNPNLRQTLHRTAKVMAAEAEFLHEQLARAWQDIVRHESTEQIELDLFTWQSLPLALKRSTLRWAVQMLRRSLRDINFEHIESAITILEKGGVGAKVTLPQGLILTLDYHTFVIAPATAPGTPAPPDQPQLLKDQVLPLNLPGVTPIPDTDWQLKANFMTREQLNFDCLSHVDRWEVYLDADVISRNLILRSRQPGDIFAPLGMGGHSQKVNEFMINQKIPANWRNHIPLIVSADQILWICGYRPDERACLRPSTQRILHLKFEQR